MWKIAKRFKVEAAHHLLGLPPTHKCSSVHGHTYEISIVLEGDHLAPEGWLMDYGVLGVHVHAGVAQLLGVEDVNNWDHGDWNTGIPQPTAEHIAAELYAALAPFIGTQYCRLASVRVWEQQDETYAEYQP